MKKNWLVGSSLVLILIIGFFLRLKNYASVPLAGQSTDEYSNTWVGLSLVRIGIPVGISGLGGIKTYPTYINPDRIFSQTIPGGALAISYPWFDHPPLMGLVSGVFSFLHGARVFEDVSTTVIRIPMIWLSTLSIGLVFLLSLLWFGQLTAVISALIFAVSPLMTISGRMVQAENGLIPLWLISLCLLALADKFGKPNLVRLAAFFAGLALLFKLSGVVAIISGAVIIGKRRSLIDYLIISLSVGGLFLFYGLAIDAPEFLAVFLSNTNRTYGIGFDAVYDLITSTKITGTKYLTDGWPLIGWLSLSFLSLRRDKRPAGNLVICVAAYLAIYLLFGSQAYGWYRLPFMPFLFISAGHLLAEGISGGNSLLPIMTLLIPLGVNLSRLFDVYQNAWLVMFSRFGLFGLIGLSFSRFQRLARLGMISLLIVVVVTTIIYTGSIDLDYWYKVH